MAGERLLSEAEIATVGAAIEAAERRTSGEIVVITAGEVSSYRYVPLAWATAAALLIPLVLVLTALPFHSIVDRGWGTGDPPSARAAVATYAVLQTLIFLAVGALVSLPAIRRRLTPRGVRRGRVRKAAVEQFLARDLHRTVERNAVLIYAALTDRDVEIVADEGALAAVDQATWDRAAAAVGEHARRGRPGEGLAEAIRLCGEALAGPFPWREGDRDELANTIVQV